MGKDGARMHGGSRFAIGVVCALVGATLWGFSGACTQYLFAHAAVSPAFITMVRMLGAGTLFLVLLAVRRRDTLKAMLRDRRTVASLAVFGIAGLFACQLTYIMVIGFTNAGTATVLQSLNIVFVLVATCLIMRRGPRVMELCGMACALVATLLIATKGDLGAINMPLAGLVWGLVNAGTVAFYVMYPKKLFARWGSMPVTGVGMFVGGIAALAVWAGLGAAGVGAGGGAAAAPMVPVLSPDCVFVLVLIVVVGTFGAFGLYLNGVSIVGGVKGSLLGAVEPVSATMFSALWLGTAFVWADWVGLVLMVATVFLVTLKRGE